MRDVNIGFYTDVPRRKQRADRGNEAHPYNSYLLGWHIAEGREVAIPLWP
jgi:hypothetical protein